MASTVVLFITIAVLILLVGIAGAVARYIYVRPSYHGVRLITSVAILLAVLVTLATYMLPRSPSGGGASAPNNQPSSTPATSTGTSIHGSTVIKVASDFPVSGQETSNGKPAQNGAEMAVSEANASNFLPGYTFQFVPKDDVGPSGTHDPAVGKNNITQLIGDALVAGIVGPFNSSVALAEMPVANQAPIALISPSNTNQCLTQVGAAVGCTGKTDLVPTLRPTGKVTYFRIATTDDHQGAAISDYLHQKLNLKKVYIIDDTQTYGVGIAAVFEKEWKTLGGTVIDHKSVATATTYVSLLTTVAATKPDVIFFGGTNSTGGTLIREQMQQIQGLQNTPFAGGDGIQNSGFATAVGLTGGPVYSTVAAVNPDILDSAKTFIADYKAKYGADQYGAYSAGGYDCAKIILQAIKAAIQGGAKTPKDANDSAGAQTFRQAVIDAVQKINYSGVTGTQTFDANGDTTNKVISIYQLAAVNSQPDWKFLDQVIVK
jgi:branched-chain amino acid transport system substrate-binding protein